MARLTLPTAALAAVALVGTSHADSDVSVDSSTSIFDTVHRVEVGGFIGGFIANDDHEFYEFGTVMREPLGAVNFATGIRAAYMPIAIAGVEVEGQFVPTGEGSLLGLGIHAIGQYELSQGITPFAVAGLGTIGVSSDELGADADTIGYFGVGAKYVIMDDLSLRADARLILAPKANVRSGSTAHGEVLIGAAYTFNLGKRATSEPAPVAVAEAPAPAKDSDGDGLMDHADKCPKAPETVNGFEDEDGCPDEMPDTDGDGIKDDVDGCKDEAEDKDSFKDEDGCPDLDNDGDSIVDTADTCPLKAGPVENYGCPDTDRDGDTVVDRLDNCPDQAGSPDSAGCKKRQLVTLQANKIELRDAIFFRRNSARIRRRSNRLLDNIVAVLVAHPEVKKVRVEGHTDDRGNDAHNLDLSQRRAQAVVDYLVNKGIGAERLQSIGHGETKPLTENTGRKSRAKNRRVEFNIE